VQNKDELERIILSMLQDEGKKASSKFQKIHKAAGIKNDGEIMTTNKEIESIRAEEIRLALKYFNGKASCCSRSITKKKRKKIIKSFMGFQYHHLEYRDGEPRRKNYPKGATGTWQYKRDVLPFVEKYHSEFLLVDTPHHHIIERLYRVYKHHPEWLELIIIAVKRTKT